MNRNMMLALGAGLLFAKKLAPKQVTGNIDIAAKALGGYMVARGLGQSQMIQLAAAGVGGYFGYAYSEEPAKK